MTERRSLIDRVDTPEQRLALLAAVAMKALSPGKAPEAERLLASTVADFQDLALYASTADELERVARMRVVLAPILRQLEASTGKRWTRCLDAPNHQPWTAPTSPRRKA